MANNTRDIAVLLLMVPALLAGCSDGNNTGDTGAVRVVVTTEGAVPDTDGYQVTLVGQPNMAVATRGEVAIDALSPGQYSLQLAGLAANCSVVGSNPRTVEVAAGEEVVTEFSIFCPAGIRILTETTGIDPDRNGFAVRIGADAFNRIPASGSTLVTSSVAGALQMDVTDVAANCTPDPGNPPTVSVVGPVTEVTLRFSCVQALGAIEVTVMTQGWDDACKTVILSVDEQRRTTNEAGNLFENLPQGQHTVSISGLRPHCFVAGDSVVVATVEGLQTAYVSFHVNDGF